MPCGARIGEEHRQQIGEPHALDRVAADADPDALAEPFARQAIADFVGQRAALRHDRERARAQADVRQEAELDLAGNRHARRGAADPGGAGSAHGAADADRVVQRNTFRHRDDQLDAGGQRFLRPRPAFPSAVPSRPRPPRRWPPRRRAQSGNTGTPAASCASVRAGRAADDIGAVGAHQRRMGAAHAAGDALHDDGVWSSTVRQALPPPRARGGGASCRGTPPPPTSGRGQSPTMPPVLATPLPDPRSRTCPAGVPPGCAAPRRRRARPAAPRPAHAGLASAPSRSPAASANSARSVMPAKMFTSTTRKRRARRDPLQHAYQPRRAAAHLAGADVAEVQRLHARAR